MRSGRCVYDGMDELDRLGGLGAVATVVADRCPACGAAIDVDTVAVVERGASAFSAAREGRIVADEFASIGAALDLPIASFDGVSFLRGSEGLTAHLGDVTCDACRSELVAVVSYGEFQPARWQLWYDGLVGVGTRRDGRPSASR